MGTSRLGGFIKLASILHLLRGSELRSHFTNATFTDFPLWMFWNSDDDNIGGTDQDPVLKMPPGDSKSQLGYWGRIKVRFRFVLK